MAEPEHTSAHGGAEQPPPGRREPYNIRFYIEDPAGDVYGAEALSTTQVGDVAADFFEERGWPTRGPNGQPQRGVPPSWAQAQMSLYITYPLEQLAVASPIIAAALAGLIRGQMRWGERVPVLLLIDEAPTVALQNLPTYLATMGGYGVTALVYAQNLTQLDAVYGPAQARALLSNCLHQLYYVPRDLETARHMSDLLGDAEYQQRSIAQHPEVRADGLSTPPAQTTIPQPRGNVSYTTTPQRRRRLAPEQMLGLSADTVLCLSRQGKQSVTFLGERLDPRSQLAVLPPPSAVVPSRMAEAARESLRGESEVERFF
ncbi:MAG: TraG/TraD/VirD4 family protein [Chloroflexales bacterium]|nr:TraG/TraD/VirD4 family protein [Chloroflexales bacterium]